MNEIFRKNFATLCARYPNFKEYIQPELEIFQKFPEGNDNESFVWADMPDGQKNLKYQRKNPLFKGFYHGMDPRAETLEVMDKVDLKHPTMVFIFGMGLGYLLKEFLDNRPAGNFVLLVIERNPQIFLRALCVHDFTKAFEDVSISWVVERNLPKAKSMVGAFIQDQTIVSRVIRILATPNALASEDEYYSQVAKHLMSARDQVTLLTGNSVYDCFRGFENTLRNIPEALTNAGLESLRDKFPGKTCISVAAGPSVNEHWDTLKAVQGKIPIIACDTLLKPMSDRGIFPDFVTALERDDIVTDFFRNQFVHERTTLVAPTLILKESFDEFKGQKLMYAPMPSYADVLALNFLMRYHGGSSAGNLNLTIANVLGFTNIILVGHNLAYGYKTNETHVRGTIDPSRERSRTQSELLAESQGMQIETQDDTDVVATRLEWNLYRNQIENYIANTPQKRWINTALKGAKIAGAETMTLTQALESTKPEHFDLYPIKKELTKTPAPEIIHERETKIKEGASKSIERLSHWLSKTGPLVNDIKSWRKKIEDKELEGKQVSIDWLNERIDRILEIKVEAINNDPHFYNLAVSILFPAHFTFEKLINEMPAMYTTDYELKRDFILKHEQYFEIWNKWLPDVRQVLEDFLLSRGNHGSTELLVENRNL
ncbi:MAG: motility associated factor glycosyltransferase family protein [Deltaproteobacteria bacterium]|nr:motility associated factor glycosyltransferase family protein [Deltaproteobacteria bacterium]